MYNMESLPKQFVLAMRTLFDIMDDKHTGYVRLKDIENRWRDDRTKGLPRGVIESLQKVASPEGFLTFELFCTGLKICLLRNQVENSSNKFDSQIDESEKNVKHSKLLTQQSHRPPSAPNLNIDETPVRERNWNETNVPENMNQQRTTSMPMLLAHKDTQDMHMQSSQNLDILNNTYGAAPPKPPRLDKNLQDRKDLARITCALPEDESSFLDNEHDDVKQNIILSNRSNSRGHGDGRPNTELNQFALRRAPRRREPRRHTLHNGVDYNLLKRMKQIEQEKDVLLQGLASVEEAREWYLKQLSEVQERMRIAGRMGAYVEPWSEAQQERLELLRARVLELNRQLGALAVGWRHGPLSLHMNLALPSVPISITDNPEPSPSHTTVLRTQNRMLVEEVNRKNERISILEREKSSLIQELLLQRNRTKMMENFN